MDRDLTKGNPLSLILALSIPQILSAILQQLYNTIDALIVGNYVGEAALAGVGLSQPVAFLMMSIMMGLSAGVSVIVGQYYGARKYCDMRYTIGTAMTSLAVIVIIMSIIGVNLVDPILQLINTPVEAYSHARDYMKIFFTGGIFMLLYNLYSGILRAVGDAKSPLLFLGIASVLNIVLDLVFVVKFNMGTAGAAYATVISQGISSLLSHIYISKRVPLVALGRDEFKFYKDKFKLILRFGVPSATQMSIIAVGNMAIQNLLNGYGVAAVAGYTSAIRIDSFVVAPYMNVGVALSNFTGQNMGARKFDRVKQGLKSAYILLIIISLITLPIVWFFADSLVGIFLDNPNGRSLQVGVQMLHDLVPLYIFLGFLNNTSGLLRGAGDNMFSLYGSIFSITIRIVAAYALTSLLAIRSIWIAQGIGWIAGYVFVMARFVSGKWKKKGVKLDDKMEDLEEAAIEDEETMEKFDRDKLNCRR